MPFEPRATAATFGLALPPPPLRLAFPLNDFAARFRAGVALAGASGAGKL
jgi:hypothetical protein